MCVCVCVREREREIEIGRKIKGTERKMEKATENGKYINRGRERKGRDIYGDR